MRNMAIFTTIFVSIFVLGCSLLPQYSDDSSTSYAPYVAPDIRIIKGSILEEKSDTSPSLRGASNASFTNTIAGIKVFAPYDPTNFVYTDEFGRFELTIDMVAYRRWKKQNSIPTPTQTIASSTSNTTPSASIDEDIPIVAKKEVIISGKVEIKSTSIVVHVGNKKSIDLDEESDPQNNTSFWIKRNVQRHGFIRHNGNMIANAKVYLLNSLTGEVVSQIATDNSGKFELDFAPGVYKLMAVVKGLVPLILDSFSLEGGLDSNIGNLDVPDVPVGLTVDGSAYQPEVVQTSVPPDFYVAVNGKKLAENDVLSVDLNSDLSIKMNVTDKNGSLGALSGFISGNVLFNEIKDYDKSVLEYIFNHKMTLPGTFSIELHAKDFDKINKLKVEKTSNVKFKITGVSKLGFFSDSLGVKIFDSDGNLKDSKILVDNLKHKNIGDEFSFDVESGDLFAPFIKVNTKSHAKSKMKPNSSEGALKKVPQEYEIVLGQTYNFNGRVIPFCKTKIDDRKYLTVLFEDSYPGDKWHDGRYNDVGIKISCYEKTDSGNFLVNIDTEATHDVKFKFFVNVKPIIVTVGKIAGHVLDDITNKPIPNALVAISDSDKVTITDENGYFELVNIDGGTYDLIVTSNGYKVKTFTGITVPSKF